MTDPPTNANDGQTFHRVAEAVLAISHFPLTAREIVERGIDRGLFGDHVFGRTPEKSMQARLSIEIIENGQSSKFVRTGRGRFTLRRNLDSGTEVTEQVAADQTRLEEYRAIPRVLATPQEDVLCVLSETYQSSLTFQGIDTSPKALLATLLSGNTTHISRSDVEDVNYAKQFVTYVIVQCGHHVLSFERSHLSRAAEFLRGSKCIGFGGHVSAADLTIFSEFDHGLSECARREVSEELSVYRTRADVKSRSSTQNLTQKLVRESPLELIGVLNDDSSEVGRRHVAVVYRLWISNWDDARRLRKGESSIRSLEWIDLTDDTIDLNKYEYWSQLCLRKFYPSASLSHSGLEIVNPTKLSRAPVLVIAGRVGSGKSATARYLATTLSVPIVNSGQVLGEIMKAGPLSEIGRENFQAAALNFITKPVGPRRLAKALATEVRRLGGKAIIDGIRHLETYHMLVD